MRPRTPRTTRPDTLCPYTTRFRSERERGVAAPVEKQQNLLAGNQGPADGLAQRRRQPAGAEALQPRRPVLSQVDEVDLRQHRIAVTLRQVQRLVAPGLHVVEIGRAHV